MISPNKWNIKISVMEKFMKYVGVIKQIFIWKNEKVDFSSCLLTFFIISHVSIIRGQAGPRTWLETGDILSTSHQQMNAVCSRQVGQQHPLTRSSSLPPDLKETNLKRAQMQTAGSLSTPPSEPKVSRFPYFISFFHPKYKQNWCRHSQEDFSKLP